VWRDHDRKETGSPKRETEALPSPYPHLEKRGNLRETKLRRSRRTYLSILCHAPGASRQKGGEKGGKIRRIPSGGEGQYAGAFFGKVNISRDFMGKHLDFGLRILSSGEDHRTCLYCSAPLRSNTTQTVSEGIRKSKGFSTFPARLEDILPFYFDGVKLTEKVKRERLKWGKWRRMDDTYRDLVLPLR